MLTIREDALSLDYLRTNPDVDDLMLRLLTEESFDIWDNTPAAAGIRLVNEALKRATGADLSDIVGLVKLLDEYESSIRYDCLAMGMRLHLLGTQSFSWGELLAIVQNSPRNSAFYRAQNPKDWMWTETEHLLAAAVDALNLALYQNGGGKGPQPKPIKRPGIDDGQTKHAADAYPRNEMAQMLGGQFAELSNTTKT